MIKFYAHIESTRGESHSGQTVLNPETRGKVHNKKRPAPNNAIEWAMREFRPFDEVAKKKGSRLKGLELLG